MMPLALPAQEAAKPQAEVKAQNSAPSQANGKAQEIAPAEGNPQETAQPQGTDENAKPDASGAADITIKKHSLFFSAAPIVMINTDSAKDSAPSPVMFGGGVGGTLFQQWPVAFQPRLTFFINYYMWDGENARPAEIENRTAIALSFLIDLNAVKIIRRGKHTFQAGGGISILARIGILANGVNADGSALESHQTAATSFTDGEAISSINKWFWSNAHFLYPDITFCWLYDLPNGWKAGLSANVYIPLGSIADGRGVDGMLLTVGGRLEI